MQLTSPRPIGACGLSLGRASPHREEPSLQSGAVDVQPVIQEVITEEEVGQFDINLDNGLYPRTIRITASGR